MLITPATKSWVEDKLKCVSEEDLKDWFSLYLPTNRVETTKGKILENFCGDCTEEHRNIMTKEGRCIFSCLKQLVKSSKQN